MNVAWNVEISFPGEATVSQNQDEVTDAGISPRQGGPYCNLYMYQTRMLGTLSLHNVMSTTSQCKNRKPNIAPPALLTNPPLCPRAIPAIPPSGS